MQALNIVNLIESNPITKLSNTYNGKLLCKIKENFTEMEQQLFVSSFYCYLNYNSTTDFVIDLDNIWKWLGFKQKVKSKILLEKHFILDIDYKFLLSHPGKQDSNELKHGGHNKETFMLNIKCFKLFCIKADTTKSNEIHEYFVKLEEILQQIIQEESSELKQQLEQKENTIIQIKESKEYEKRKAAEQALISQFPLNTECIYFGKIDNKNEQGEKLVKFGHTNDLQTRCQNHRKIYDNFILEKAFRVQNKVEIENLIKTYPKIKKHIRTIEVQGKKKTEIIAYDDTNFTINRLAKYIEDILHSKTYSIDNFNRIMKENEELQTEIKNLKEERTKDQQTIETQSIEIINLKEKLEKNQKAIETVVNENQSVYHNVLLPEDELHKKFNEFVDTVCIVRPDVEELSVNIEGRFRLWLKTKPKKETFHALKNYLDTRFRQKRVNGNHGYGGIILKTVEYIKQKKESDVQDFLFQRCAFSDTGKILNSVLLDEYQKWKQNVEKPITGNEIKEIKEYLNSLDYVLKATVWTGECSNEGYYGIGLKEIKREAKIVSSTGKKVQKRKVGTNDILKKWDSIAAAAFEENINSAKMSRSVKEQKVYGEYSYCLA